MSIATSVTALQTAKSDIATAITTKGGTVNTGDGFSDFATDIGTIASGGSAGALPFSVSFASAVAVPKAIVGTASLSGFAGNVSFASAT